MTAIFLQPGIHRHLDRAIFGEFDGIGHQVHQDLAQAMRIPLQCPWHMILYGQHQGQFLAAGALGK